MARPRRSSWYDLYVTPEGVAVQSNEKGERRERKLSLFEAVELHVRADANAQRTGPREDPDNPRGPYNETELREHLEAHFKKVGLK
jgi:hypothetical protein